MEHCSARDKSLPRRAVSSIAEVLVETWHKLFLGHVFCFVECVWFCGLRSVRSGECCATFEPYATNNFELAIRLHNRQPLYLQGHGASCFPLHACCCLKKTVSCTVKRLAIHQFSLSSTHFGDASYPAPDLCSTASCRRACRRVSASTPYSACTSACCASTSATSARSSSPAASTRSCAPLSLFKDAYAGSRSRACQA